MLLHGQRVLRNLVRVTACCARGWVTSALVAGSVFVTTGARADVVDSPGVTVPTPKGTLEIGLGAGGALGRGELTNDVDTRDAADDGYGGFVEVGWRATPRFMVGAYGGAAQYVRGGLIDDRLTARSFQAGVQGQFHVFPYERFDPWIGLGAGWHGLWLDPKIAPNQDLQGIDLARVRLGIDIRLDPGLALGPYGGVDVTTFLRRSVDGGASGGIGFADSIATFFSAGLAARFDVIDVWLGPPPPKGFEARAKTSNVAKR